MADTATVGILNTMLTMNTSSYESGAKKAAAVTQSVKAGVEGLSSEVKKLTPLADRMVKSLGGDKLLYTANSLTTAVTKLGGASKLTEAEQARVNRTLDAAIQKYKQLGQQAPQAMLDLEKATRRAGGGTDFLNTKMVALGAAVGTFAAQLAGQAIRSVINMGKEAFESAGKILDLSNATGLSAKTIQQMQFVAEQTGASLDGFTNAAFKLGAAIAGGGPSVKAALRDLGIEWEKIRGLSMDQQWNMVSAALSKYTDEGERNRIGIALMGRGFKEVAAAIGQGYAEMAGQAKTATDAQLKELDRLNDEWDKFKRNLTTGFGAAMGRMVLETRIRGEVADEFFRRLREEPGFKGFPSDDRAGRFLNVEEEAQRRLQLQLFDARTKDVALTKEQAEAQITYAKRVREATAELRNLSAAERQELTDAQALDATQEELIEKVIRFGVSADKAEDVLKVFSGAMREADKDSRDLAKSQRELAEATARSRQAWFDVQVQLDKADLERNPRRLVNGKVVPVSRMTIIGDLNALPDLEKATEKLEQAWSKMTILGDLIPKEAAVDLSEMVEQLEAMERPARMLRQLFQDIFAPVLGGVTDAIGSLFSPGPEKPRRGLLSAEEYTRAMREFEGRWDRFINRIGQSFKDLLSNLLSRFVNEFLGGMLRALAGSAFGQAFGGWLARGLGMAGGLGGGGGAGGLLQAAGGAVLPSIFGAGAGTSAMALAPGLTAGLNAQLGITAAGTAGTGGGMAALGALLTNPWTIGIAGAVIAAPFIVKGLKALFGGGPDDMDRIKKARELTQRGVPQSKWPDWVLDDDGVRRRIREGRLFEPVTFNAFGRTFGEGFKGPDPLPTISPVGLSMTTQPSSDTTRTLGHAQPVVIHNHISAIDARGIRDFVRSREFTDSMSRAVEDNANFMTSRFSRALNR